MAVLVPSRMYTVPALITNPGAVTNVVLMASATRPLAVVRVTIEAAAAALPSVAGARVRLVRKTSAPTVTAIAASTFINHDPSDADAAFTAGHTATAADTGDGDFIERGWRSDVGFDWAPTPEEYILIPAGVTNGFAVKHAVAPPAGTYAFAITVHEIA